MASVWRNALLAASLIVLAQTGVSAQTAAPTNEWTAAVAIEGFSRARIRVADGPGGENVRAVAATDVALPATASLHASERNYRRVVDAQGRVHWVSSASLLLPDSALHRVPDAYSSCTGEAYASRGMERCGDSQ